MMRIAIPAGALCILSVALPVALPTAPSGVSAAECIAIVDQPAKPHEDATLERCTALYPKDVELLADLGARYEARGEAANAEAAYARALTIDPGYAELRLRLGRLLLKRGAAADARSQAEAALRVQPNRHALLDLLRDASQASAGTRP